MVSSSIPAAWTHQAKTREFFDRRTAGFDFSSPGTGKTRAHLEVYANRKVRKRLLVLCPMTLMYSAWGADIERFTPQLTYSLAVAGKREQAFDLATDVVIMNTDGVKWLASKEGMVYLSQFDHLIIDESTAFKNKDSQRTRALFKIRKFFKRKYLLSGTPTPNSVTEMWAPAFVVDGGKRLGTSFFHFRSSVQVPEQIGPMANHIKWHDREGSAQALEDMLNDILIRHSFEEVMKDVPANHRDMKSFDLNAKARAIYNQFENDAIMELKGDVISAVHAATMRQKLLQIASGAVYNASGGYTIVDHQRYELISDLVEEREHSVVFFNWKHQRDELETMFTKRGITFAIIDGDVGTAQRIQTVKDYQTGKLQTLLLHPKTGAHGLTLTRGDTTIISSPFYEADLLQQAIARIYRGGQTKKTNTLLICARGTADEIVYERLDDKEGRMADLLTLVQQRRKK